MNSEVRDTNQIAQGGTGGLVDGQANSSTICADDALPSVILSGFSAPDGDSAIFGAIAFAARASLTPSTNLDPWDDLPIHGGLDAGVWFKRQLRRVRGYLQNSKADRRANFTMRSERPDRRSEASLGFRGGEITRTRRSTIQSQVPMLGLVLLLATLSLSSRSATAQIFVDANAAGSNTGVSWEDAFTELQPALAAAVEGDEIWVACASYLPTERRNETEPRSASFFIRSGLSVFGGFAGGELTREERQPDPLLNGCSLGDSATVTEDFAGFFHLLTVENVPESVLIDGFSIVGGRATGGFARGAGARIVNADVTFRNIRFDDVETLTNRLGAGGAVFSENSELALENVQMSNCRSGLGGGVALFGGNLTARDWTITTCLAGFGGGPGLYMRNSADVEITDALFDDNRGNNNGGAILNDGGNLTIRRSVFTGNRARAAGAIAHRGSDLILENSVLVGNRGNRSAGVFVSGSGTTSVTNSTIAFNESQRADGVGIVATGSTTVAVNNSIVFGNFRTDTGPGSPDIPQIGREGDSAALTATFSIIEGGFDGLGNQAVNPLFVSDPNPGDGTWETLSDNDFGDVRLQLASPAIDAGDNLVLVDQTGTLPDTAADLPLDVDRKPRLEDTAEVVDTGVGGPPVIDIGAFEFSTLIFRDGFE